MNRTIVIAIISAVVLCLVAGIIAVVFGSALINRQAAVPESLIQTGIAETLAAQVTDTAVPTLTPSFTITLSSTSTPTLTATFTETATNTTTNTSTPTLPSETQTAIAVGETRTEAAAILTATRAQFNANTTSTAVAVGATRTQYAAGITGTAEAIGATRTEQASERTATAAAAQATKTFLAQYGTIDYRELNTYADDHIGEKVYVTGRVFNIIDRNTLQIYLGNTYDAAVIVTKRTFSGIYEDDRITVYGTIAGFYEGTNSFGGSISQPLITDAFFEAPPAAPPRPTATPLPGGATLISCDPSGGYANVGNVQSFFIESHGGFLEAGNGNTGQYMYSFERAIYYALDGSGPFVFCTGNNW